MEERLTLKSYIQTEDYTSATQLIQEMSRVDNLIKQEALTLIAEMRTRP